MAKKISAVPMQKIAGSPISKGTLSSVAATAKLEGKYLVNRQKKMLVKQELAPVQEVIDDRHKSDERHKDLATRVKTIATPSILKA